MENLNSYLNAYTSEFKFDFDNNIILNWYPRRILEKSARTARVLELGIGHGHSCNWFSQYFSSYTVIDASSEVINRYKTLYPSSRARIVQSYFEDFTCRGGFDLIIMGFVLEHVADAAAILNHYYSFINPGGRCFVAVPNAESLHRRLGKEAGYLDNLFRLGEGDLSLGHKRLYSVKTLSRQIEECGYNIKSKEGVFLKPFTTAQLQSLNLSADVLDAMCRVGIHYPELSAALLFEAELRS
jgi:2-polyprenyl-3-methyl-5-hydroxy-6-metoxy-1,4-benzoquinol methylase